MKKGTYAPQKSVYVCTEYLLEVYKDFLQYTFDKGTDSERNMKVVSIQCSYLNRTNPPKLINFDVLIEIKKRGEWFSTKVVLSQYTETTKTFYEMLHPTLCEISLKMWEDNQIPE